MRSFPPYFPNGHKKVELTDIQRRHLDTFLSLIKSGEPVSHTEFTDLKKSLSSGEFLAAMHGLGGNVDISREWCDILEKSMALVEDMIADGIDFSPAELTEVTMLFFESKDRMVRRFTLMKKIARFYAGCK